MLLETAKRNDSGQGSAQVLAELADFPQQST